MVASVVRALLTRAAPVLVLAQVRSYYFNVIRSLTRLKVSGSEVVRR